MKTLVALVSAIILISFGSITYAFVDKSETENQQEAIVVKDSNGDSVGIVTSALVDRSGNISFIILGINKGMEGNKEIAVPVSVFSIDRQNKILLLDVTKEELARAPEFDVSDLRDFSFAEKVYRYFGLMPAWTEGTTEGEAENDN